MKRAIASILFGLLAGCGQPAGKSANIKTSQNQAADHGHSHDRGKKMLVDAGPYHALLTSHLSAKGNELDMFFETPVDKNPQPVALPFSSIKAFVQRAGEEAKEVIFEPAPPDERPKDEKPGTCSHFVAKVPWLNAADTVSVTFFLELEKDRYRVTWENFNLKKYAHHEE